MSYFLENELFDRIGDFRKAALSVSFMKRLEMTIDFINCTFKVPMFVYVLNTRKAKHWTACSYDICVMCFIYIVLF